MIMNSELKLSVEEHFCMLHLISEWQPCINFLFVITRTGKRRNEKRKSVEKRRKIQVTLGLTLPPPQGLCHALESLNEHCVGFNHISCMG